MYPIILLHGAIGAGDQLEPLRKYLEKDTEVYVFSFDGHGGKPFNTDSFSIPSFANQVLDFIKKENFSAPNIFGYSMGGYVAMYIARYFPATINEIITLGTKYKWDPLIASKEIKMLDPEIMMTKIPVFAKQLEARHHPNDWKIVLEKTRELMLSLGDHPALTIDDLKKINNNCCVMLGDRDKMVSIEETVEVYRTVSNCQLNILPNTPHPIEQINLEYLASQIRNYLSQP